MRAGKNLKKKKTNVLLRREGGVFGQNQSHIVITGLVVYLDISFVTPALIVYDHYKQKSIIVAVKCCQIKTNVCLKISHKAIKHTQELLSHTLDYAAKNLTLHVLSDWKIWPQKPSKRERSNHHQQEISLYATTCLEEHPKCLLAWICLKSVF